MGEPILYISDGCSASAALTKKKMKKTQTRWVCLFHCKDRDSFEDCLRENDVIPSREQRALVRQQLAETKHAKLLLKTDQPVGYTVR